MTPKRRTRSVTKPAKSPTSSAARRGSPARRAASSVATPGAGPPVKPRAAPSAAASVPALKPGPALTALPPAEPTLLERAERLRDDVLRSKLTHPDPWTYTAKARAWGEGIQALVAEIAVAGQTPGLHARFTTLSAEVEGDSDFQRARQLF
jgi:hypothetical protein